MMKQQILSEAKSEAKPEAKPEVNRAFLERLDAIAFGPIAFKLMNPEEGHGWTLEQATCAIEQYRRFLFLRHLYPDEPIVPSREVDRVWHTHILDTAKYREDCELLFGQFLDHWPYFGMTDDTERQLLDQAFARTQALLQRHFSTTVSTTVSATVTGFGGSSA